MGISYVLHHGKYSTTLERTKDISKSPIPGFKVYLKNDEDIFEWQVGIMGPPATLYQGGYFLVCFLHCTALTKRLKTYVPRQPSNSHKTFPSIRPPLPLTIRSFIQMCTRMESSVFPFCIHQVMIRWGKYVFYNAFWARTNTWCK